jgi:hypothetical protein
VGRTEPTRLGGVTPAFLQPNQRLLEINRANSGKGSGHFGHTASVILGRA